MILKERLSYPVVLAVLVIAVFMTYGNALFNQFVWDDGYLIVENPLIKTFENFPRLFSGDLMASTAIRHYDSGYYRPLSMASFMLDYKIWNLNPFGYHLVNVLIHLLNSFLVFCLMEIVFQRRFVAFGAALFFVVHPIHVEAVTPIYNRMGIQASFFVLLALVLFAKSNGLKRKGMVLGCLAAIGAGMLSKEEAIVAPLLLALYDYFYFRKQHQKSFFSRSRIVFYGMVVAVSVSYLFLRQSNLTRYFSFSSMGDSPALSTSLFFHLATNFKIFGYAVFKTICPFHPQPIYWIEPEKAPLSLLSMGGFFLMAGLLSFFVYYSRRDKNLSFLVGLFLISLLPFLNFIPIAETYVFQERFLYFPSIAICAFLALAVSSLFSWAKDSSHRQLFVGLFSFILVSLFGYLTAIGNYTWRTDLSLWRDAVKKSPDSQMAHLNLGQVLLKGGQWDEAKTEIEKSLQTPHPLAGNSVYLARVDLAKIFMLKNDLPQAQRELEKAIAIAEQINLNPFAAYDKLGLVFAQSGQKDLAEKAFLSALSQNKDFIPTRYNLGVLYFEQKDYSRAEEQFRMALKADPYFSEALFGLGLVAWTRGDGLLAKNYFEQCLRIDRNHILAKQYLNSFQKGGVQ